MYSQQGEDIYMLKNFFNKRVNDGFYVEIGAVDGVTYSNSKFFEDSLGYKGMLIEAQPSMFSKLTQTRPNNILINKAVSMSTTPVTFIGNNPCGGIEANMNDSFKNAWHKHSNKYIVETTQFDKLFDEYNVKYVDFMTLDVEGGELDVLSTIDFSKVEIYVICIELDEHNPLKDKQCRDLLLQNGFKFNSRMFINEFWVNENYSRKSELFDTNLSFKFSGIDSNKKSNLGTHYFAERHLITDINNYLKTN